MPLAGAAASCPGSTRRDSIQLGKTHSCAVSQQRGDSRCFWVVQEQDGETSPESCWGCSCRHDQVPGVARSSRNLFFSLLGREGEEIPAQAWARMPASSPPRTAFRREDSPGCLHMGARRARRSHRAWFHVYEGQGLRLLHHQGCKGRAPSIPPSFSFRGKISWFGAAYKSVPKFTLLLSQLRHRALAAGPSTSPPCPA